MLACFDNNDKKRFDNGVIKVLLLFPKNNLPLENSILKGEISLCDYTKLKSVLRQYLFIPRYRRRFPNN
jgi:hypothetical protein